MYTIIASNQFLKDMKLIKKRSPSDFEILQNLVGLLADKGHAGLSRKNVPHRLRGKFNNYWECHVKPDLLLIWNENNTLTQIELIRAGSHSDLF